MTGYPATDYQFPIVGLPVIRIPFNWLSVIRLPVIRLVGYPVEFYSWPCSCPTSSSFFKVIRGLSLLQKSPTTCSLSIQDSNYIRSVKTSRTYSSAIQLGLTPG